MHVLTSETIMDRTLTSQVMREVNSGPEIFVGDGDGGRET